MTPVDRGIQAKRLLEEPLLKDAFEGVRAKLVAAIEDSAIGDSSTHHELALSLQLLRRIEAQFKGWIRDGQLEESRQPKGR